VPQDDLVGRIASAMGAAPFCGGHPVGGSREAAQYPSCGACRYAMAAVALAMREGAEQPWPLADAVALLAERARHLLRDHDCDHHGWEETDRAIEAAHAYFDGKKPRSAMPRVPSERLERTDAAALVAERDALKDRARHFDSRLKEMLVEIHKANDEATVRGHLWRDSVARAEKAETRLAVVEGALRGLVADWDNAVEGRGGIIDSSFAAARAALVKP
jgi:hypothetical protein